MRDRRDDGIGAWQLFPIQQAHAVLTQRFLRVGLRIADADLDAVAVQFLDDVDDLGVAQIAAVLLEGQPQQVDTGALDVRAGRDHVLDRLLGNELAHAVVDAASGQDHLWVVAEHVGLVRQVIGIDADAMAADQTRLELQEVPLRSRGFKHLSGVEADPVEDDRQLIHQGDVQIALRVFDHLGCLGGLDA